jgi:hypothetical protein
MAHAFYSDEELEVRRERASGVFDELMRDGFIETNLLDEFETLTDAAAQRYQEDPNQAIPVRRAMEDTLIERISPFDPETAFDLRVQQVERVLERAGEHLPSEIAEGSRNMLLTGSFRDAEQNLITYANDVLDRISRDEGNVETAVATAVESDSPQGEFDSSLSPEARNFLRLLDLSRQASLACLEVESALSEVERVEEDIVQPVASNYLSEQGIDEPTTEQSNQALSYARDNPEVQQAYSRLDQAVRDRNDILEGLGLTDMNDLILNMEVDHPVLVPLRGNELINARRQSNDLLWGLVAPMSLYDRQQGFPDTIQPGTLEAESAGRISSGSARVLLDSSMQNTLFTNQNSMRWLARMFGEWNQRNQR